MFVEVSDIVFEAYDVIVVGSGPAGITLAKSLEKSGKRVLIIETGKQDFDTDLQDQYGAMYGRGHFDGSHWPGHWVRALGGTSLLWQGVCAPLTQRNLASWPIDRVDLDPYYPVAAALLGRSTEFLTYAAPFMTGFDFRPFSYDEPVRFGEANLAAFKVSSAIHFLLETTVNGLATNSARN